MQTSKLLSLSAAVDRYVPDGSAVVLGAGLESLIPFAGGHEIIRQRKTGLTLIAPISDILFDQIIGAGCADRIFAAWVGNVITGSGYNFRRAVEAGSVDLEDHSNLTLASALQAGAMGVPFMPTRTALGSDLPSTNPKLKRIDCPFTHQPLMAVAALNPDVAIVHAQRADQYGGAHVWGNLGVTREACSASRRIIITAEEIVSPAVIRSDPNRVITPGFRVSAVVHAPWGGHPSPVPGFYNRDHQAFLDYQQASKTRRGYEAWRARWVEGVHSAQEYLALLGEERVAVLSLSNSAPSQAADYGY